jgi:uncharacterized cupin superfamily protein
MDPDRDPPSWGHLNVASAEFAEPEVWGTLALAYRGHDGRRAAGVWRFGPGTFSYEPNHEEFLYLIDGEVRVEFADGRTLLLRQGDLVYLPEHLEARWATDAVVRAVFCSVATTEPLDY